ncbi:MAG: alpha/beta hydrolase [Legionella sp.]|jgi:pimeloyl-ACP methyl ester carboxylesterase
MIKDHLLGISTEGFHNVAYTEWGSQNSEHPPVICVHGYTRNGRDFDALAHYLSEHGRHVFCPDIAGRGDSSWFQHALHYNFEQYIIDMNALIARTHSNHVDWIGTSMGGIIGMMIAALPNSPIRQLILNDVGPQIPVHGLKKLGFAKRQTEFKSFAAAKDYYKEHHAEFGSNLTDKQWDTFTKHSVVQRSDKLFVAKFDPSIKNPKSTSQFFSDLFHHPSKILEGTVYDVDMWSTWSKIHCPVLVIHGEHSELLTPEIIRRMQRIHELTDVFTIENTGHAPALLEEAEHEVIYDWLDAIDHE